MNSNSDLSRRHFWRDLGLLLASTMTIMAGATLAPALPGMRDAFVQQDNIEFWVKFLLAVPGLCIAVSAPFFGRYLARVGRKPVLLAGLIACGISGSAGYFFHDSLMFLLGTRILLGFAVAAIMVAGMTLAADYYQGPSLANYMGLQAAFGGFGGVIFMAGAGLLADIHWTHPFLIYFLALVILPFTFLFITESPAQENPAPSIHHAASASAPNHARLMVMFCGFAFAEMLLLYLIPLNFPFFLEHLKNGSSNVISPSTTGLLMAAWLLLAAVVSRYYSKFGRHKSFQQLQAYGLVIISVGFAGLYLATNFWIAAASLLLSGIGFGVIRPNLVVWLFSLTPPAERGTRVGQLTRWYFIGQMACALIVEPVVRLLGYAGTYCLFAGIALLLGIFLLRATANDTTANVIPSAK